MLQCNKSYIKRNICGILQGRWKRIFLVWKSDLFRKRKNF